jgi:hypothetical protein
VIVESTRIFRLYRGQRSTLNPNVLFILTAHSRRLDHANSSPSSRRPQWATVIMVGSTATTGSAATAATVSPRVATASVSPGAGAAATEDAAAIGSVASDAAVGDAEAGAGHAAANGDADDADADGASGAADADGAAAHGFGFAPGGGFGVTSGRHDDREAKTPW